MIRYDRLRYRYVSSYRLISLINMGNEVKQLLSVYCGMNEKFALQNTDHVFQSPHLGYRTLYVGYRYANGDDWLGLLSVAEHRPVHRYTAQTSADHINKRPSRAPPPGFRSTSQSQPDSPCGFWQSWLKISARLGDVTQTAVFRSKTRQWKLRL